MERRDRYTLTSEENKKVFDETIALNLYHDIVAADDPMALFFRAQPGAGKTNAQARVVDTLRTESGTNTVMGIDIDGFRSFHPDYARLQQEDEASAAFYTDLDCGAWTERAIALSMEMRSHVTLEGTLRSEKPTLQTAQEYTDRGMPSELYLLAVHELTSRSRIFQRYIEQLRARGSGRYTLREAHDVAYEALPDTARKTVESGLFRKVHIIDREGDIVETVDGQTRDAAKQTVAAFQSVRRVKDGDIDEIHAVLADLGHEIADQQNDVIRHDFAMLREHVQQQSRLAIGGLALQEVVWGS